ncbi:MAG: hypothetical protein V3R87_09370 [Dehalococcoidia bacterium]
MRENEKDLEAVLARVHELENRVQWMRRAQGAAMWSGAVLLVIVGMMPMLLASGGSGPEKELRASRFVLVDDKGAERAELSFGPHGPPRLIIGNKKPVEGILLGLDDDGSPFLIMGGREDKARIGMGIMESGKPHIGLWGSGAKKAHIGLGFQSTGNPQFLLRDVVGKTRIGLSVDKVGDAVLQLRDPSGRPRALLSASGGDNTSLILTDAKGKGGGSLIVDKAGKAALFLSDSKKNPRVLIQAEPPQVLLWGEKMQSSITWALHKDAPLMLMQDKDGNPRVSFGVDSANKSEIQLLDKNRQEVWKAP